MSDLKTIGRTLPVLNDVDRHIIPDWCSVSVFIFYLKIFIESVFVFIFQLGVIQS